MKYDRLILLDYDIGALGNTIFALLSLTSDNVFSLTNDKNYFKFNANGNAHQILKFTDFAGGKFVEDIDYNPEIPLGRYDIRIGHAGDYRDLYSQFPGAHYIKILCNEFGFIYQTLAGYQKFHGIPTLTTAHNLLPILGSSEPEIIESYALCYYNEMIRHENCAKDNSIISLLLDDIIDTNLQSVIDLFSNKFRFKFDHLLVKKFITEFNDANKNLIEQSNLLYQLVRKIQNNTIVPLPADLKFYEKALLLACIGKDRIQQMPIYTETDFWKDSKVFVDNLKRK